MEFLSGALLAVDKATTFLKTRRVRRQTLFKEVIEPIFSESEKIIANYHQVFAKLETALRTEDQEAIRAAVTVFAVDRMEMKAVRTKIEAFSTAAAKFSEDHSSQKSRGLVDSEIAKFDLFLESSIGIITNRHMRGSLLSLTVFDLRSYLDGTSGELVTPRQVIGKLAQALGEADTAWRKTCALYEELKLSYALGVDGFLPTGKSIWRFWQ